MGYLKIEFSEISPTINAVKIQLKLDFHGIYLTFEGNYSLTIRILRQPLLLARSENGSILDFGDKIRCSLYLWTKMIFRALPGVIFSFSERDIKAARLL
ncbi:hypothetical protein WMO66_01370 [Faecousia sp. CLA-AA-H192]|uniref:Uncharacterized protein n=1 Tax=Faecousia intestinalis TaxID=3133167 RepID=A0ABV1G3C8_9FIRM